MGVYGDLLIIYAKPYSIYLRGTVRVLVICGRSMKPYALSLDSKRRPKKPELQVL